VIFFKKAFDTQNGRPYRAATDEDGGRFWRWAVWCWQSWRRGTLPLYPERGRGEKVGFSPVLVSIE
jgi:hypothetical protein